MPLPIPLSTDNSPTYVSELLYRLKVRDVMTTSLKTVGRKSTLRDAQALMKQNAITGLPVAEGTRLLGIVSMDDIIRALEDGTMDEPVEQRMTTSVTVLEDDMPLAFALSYMEKYRFGRFPVLDRGGELVGIITSRDIIVNLLLAMNREIEVMEQKLKPNQDHENKSESSRIHREFTTRKFDFENAGKPSSEFKRICKEHGHDPKLIRRIAVASYELEMNQVIHSLGGTIGFTMEGNRVQIIAKDQGPGIPDVEQALAEGYSTANEWVRSLGFGAGMGLPNARRVSDEFSIESTMGVGTLVVCTFHL